ncbi:MAG: RNA polymerase subunit sigma-70 [Nitrospira sp.]|nr:MAG: RNA polymerase subunit sigma-70 [Nitrospira sp.]
MSGEITSALQLVREGKKGANDILYAAVYSELRELAQRFMAGERRNHTLQPTALVNEVWIRLSDNCFENRAHFFGTAARAMRQVLVEHARRKKAEKRNSGIRPDPLAEIGDVADQSGLSAEQVLQLDEALSHLAKTDPRAAKVTELRFFAGLTMDEIRIVLGRGKTTIEDDWRTARAFLRTFLDEGVA